MMHFPQQFAPQPSGNTLTGVVPPKGATVTTVDIAPGFAPQFLVLARASWERVILVKMMVNESELPVLPQQDSEFMLYPLPAWTPEQVTSQRRLSLTWSNRSNRGAQFAYQVVVERPLPPVQQSPAPPTATIMGPPIGMAVAMNLPNQHQPTQMGPMSPPAFPLAPTPVPSVSAPQVMAPGYAIPPASPPVVGAQAPAPLSASYPYQMPPAPMTAAPSLSGGQEAHPMPTLVAAYEPPATELEAHVAGCLRVPYLAVRQQAQSYGQRYGFTPEAVLEAYVNNFGSAGLEMIPKQWLDAAERMHQQSGLDRQQLIASTVLQSLVQRIAEERDFAELRQSGAISSLIAAGPPPASPDFSVHSQASPPLATEEKPPDTSRTGTVPRVTGGQLRELAKSLKVEPGWLLVVAKTLAEARDLKPDALIQQTTATTMRLLRSMYLEDATKDVDQKLAQAESVTEALPDGNGDAAFAEQPSPQEAETARQNLIEQAVVTRSLDHICRDLVASAQAETPAPQPENS